MQKNIPILFILLVLFCHFSKVQAQQLPYAPQQLIIKFKPNTSPSEKQHLLQNFTAKETQYFSKIDAYLWSLPTQVTIQNKDLRGVVAMVDYLKRLPTIEYAEPNFRYEMYETPNDTHYDELWAMDKIQMPQAWNITTGSSNIVVGVLDSGIDWTHPDLVDNIWQNLGEDADGDGRVLEFIGGQWQFDPGDQNGIDNDGNGYADDFIGWDFYNDDNNPYDEHSHGTHCSGTIAAKGNNNLGVTGMCWNTQLAALRFIGAYGGYTSDAIDGLAYAIDMGFPITNNSWGGGNYSFSLLNMINTAEANNQLFIAAAGKDEQNNDIQPFYPSSYTNNNIISVGASNSNDQVSWFSHYGANAVDVFAPGSGIFSTFKLGSYFDSTCGDPDGDGYAFCSGSSMAAAHVSGLAALILSQCPTVTYSDVKNQILNHADVLPAYTGKCVSNGRINAFNSLNNAGCCDVEAGFNISVAVCASTPFILGNTSASATGYFWDFGDGNTSTMPSPIHNYTNPGVYTATLTAVSGACSDAYTQTIEVRSTPEATFVYEVNGLNVSFYANNNESNTIYNWTLSGASFSNTANTNYTFFSEGTYNICLEVSDVCDSNLSCQVVSISDESLCASSEPVIEWERSFGGSSDDNGYSVKQTNDGNFIVTGNTYSNNGYVSNNNGGADGWIIKLDVGGTIIWEHTIGGSSNDDIYFVEETIDGGYIVCGMSKSNNGDLLNNNGLSDSWVVKLNSNGQIIWSKNYGGSANDYALSVVETQDGDYVFAGFTESVNGDVSENNGLADFWIVKINSFGNIVWEKSYGGSNNEYAYSIKQTNEGGYIVAGMSQSNNGDVSGNYGSFDSWIVKLNSNGELVWEQNFGGSNGDWAYSIEQTSDNGYIFSGYTGSDDGDVAGDVVSNNGNQNAWVVKLSQSGELIWEHSFGGSYTDWSNNIQQVPDGGYVLAGLSDSNDGDVSGNNGLWDFWIVKVNVNGELIWDKNLGGSSNERAYSIDCTIDGGYVAVGYSESSNGDLSTNNGSRDFWIVKLSPDNVNITASFSTPSLNTCLNTPTTFTNTSTAASIYEWQINNTTISTSTNFTYTFTTPGDYLITLIATNADGCQDTYSETITVAANCVWPGDCNNDGTADLYDFLAIGLGYNNTGYTRNNNNIDWSPKYAEDWPTSFTDVLYNGLNYKFADSNGDGIINFADTTAVLNNLDLTHTTPSISNDAAVLNPEAYVVADAIGSVFYPNTPIVIDIKARNVFNSEPLNLYGIIFELGYPAEATSILPQVSFSNSCLGTLGVDFMATYKIDPTTQKIRVALTRLNHTNIICDGPVAQLIVVIEEVPIDGVEGYFIIPNDPFMIDNNGVIIPMGGQAGQFDVYNDLSFDSADDGAVITPTIIDTRIWLQGNYIAADYYIQNSIRMYNDLRNNNLLPTSQPFNNSPWYYAGTETLSSNNDIPINAVDWVLVEIRNVAGTAIVDQQAGFVLTDGSIVDKNGEEMVFYSPYIYEANNYHLLIRTRNHLDVISSTPIQVQNGQLQYDFTTAATQAEGAQQVQLATGIYGLYAGDIDGNGIVNVFDFNNYANQSAQINQYTNADLNLDGNVTITDFNTYFPNASIIGVDAVRY